MGKVFRVGTRGSALALRQVNEVIPRLRYLWPGVKFKIVTIPTYGDRDRFTPISDIEGTDFFTREIDDALLKGEIELAVHSAKDLPDNLREGLKVLFITPSIDPYDCLVSKRGLRLGELPPRAKIGTSSTRRKSQLKRFREDFEICDIRGNIEERLQKLDNSALDAIVIAAAGLIRLGLQQRITEKLPFDIMRPHPLQGALAIIVRADTQI